MQVKIPKGIKKNGLTFRFSLGECGSPLVTLYMYCSILVKGKVCMAAKWPITLELIPISVT